MESAESKAARYEQRHSGTGVSVAQAAERQDRLDRKTERGRRLVTVPELPWHRERA
jgi:hypothetical protein